MVRLRQAAGWSVLCSLVWLGARCTPDITLDDKLPESLPFDPAADPPLLPQPTNLLIDPATGLISFGAVGLDVPDDCSAQPDNEVAQCEFYQYLEQLDGFPTDLAATAPVTAALALETLSVPRDVVVVDATRGKLMADIEVDNDVTNSALAITPHGGWDVGTYYFLGIRGYEAGPRSAQGWMYVASVPYFLLKRDDSLTCGAASASELSPSCPYYALIETPGAAPATIFRDLSDLESIRQLYTYELGLWSVLDTLGGLTRDQAATAWAFPTHSASVVELNPTLGMLPAIVGDASLRLTVKGSVQSNTLTPFRMGSPGSVFLLDLTALEDNDLLGGLPVFDVSFDDQAIVLEAETPLVDGHTYAILMTDAVTNEAGVALVPAPLTVLLRARGPLLDDKDQSTVDGVSDADAAELETGRRDLAMLLDDPTFTSLTQIEREQLVYLYAFTFPHP